MSNKEKLNEMKVKLDEMKQILKSMDGDMALDIGKSIIILDNKIKYYSSNYDALKSLKKIKSEEAEK